MKTLVLPGTAALGALLVLQGSLGDSAAPDAVLAAHLDRAEASAGLAAADLAPADLEDVVDRYCQSCHNDRRLTGNLSLESFDVASAAEHAPTAEKMIVKLRAGMMPPPGARRPSPDTLLALVETLERTVDEAAARRPDPGTRSFQRLNRAEYEASIRELLGLDIDAGDYLPLDTKSANFDNIADAQLLSPTLIGAYLSAAAEIRRLALGDPGATSTETEYDVSRWASQRERVEGAPFGTRGGTSVVHTFPADGEYVFRASFHHETTGALFGEGHSALHTAEAPEQLEISIDGERVALLEIDRWMSVSDPDGVTVRTEPIHVQAGPRRVTAAFIRRMEGPVQDLVSPHEWSLASTAIAGMYGVLALPHLRDLVISGPRAVTGISETPSRRKVFTCRPGTPEEERPCAREIVTRLGSRAFRRALSPDDVEGLMALYDAGAAENGFEGGIGMALEGILASPQFVFRFEEQPEDVEPGESYPLPGPALASRLSYFLWGSPPDDELLEVAATGELSRPEVLEAQTRRMLADPRSEALATRFAAQWLRLQDLEKINPDVRVDPDFDQQLREGLQRETELFFEHLVREDRPLLELFTADYTFVNERVAEHYGIPGVVGDRFRRVEHVDPNRRGLLGHGSVLTLTSVAARTSPVLRGKWVMEVLLGTPPPPPPPGVPDLEETEAVAEGRQLTTRERMEMHRASPTCNSCHQFIDPIGLALDNYDVTGKWRIREAGLPLDTRGEMYDGTPVESPGDLLDALLKRPVPLVRTFTQNLMAYGLGRRVEHYDQPAVRAITRAAAEDGYRMSAFIHGVVQSDAFRMQRASTVAVDDAQDGRRSR